MPAWTAKIRLIPRRDLLSTLAVAGLFAVAGALGLSYLAHRVMIRAAQDRLMDLTQSTVLKTNAIADEAVQQLHTMNQSPLPRCSGQDLETLRAQIFKTGALLDAGWFQGERVRCSAQMPGPLEAVGEPRRVAVLPAQLELYRSVGSFSIHNKPTILVRLGDAYVNIGELAREFSGPPWMQFAATVTDIHGRPTGAHDPGTAPIFTSPGRHLQGDRVYTTACSARYPLCDTVSVSLDYVLGREIAPTLLALACGGLMGGMLGGVLAVLYRRRKTIESQLYRAIRRGQLYLEYQPIARVRDQQIVGAEALCRWRNESGELEPPHDFIRIAEQKNWIGALTKVVVNQALEQCGDLLRENPDFRLSVNLSPYCLRIPDMIAELERLLAAHRVKASSVALEITESAAAHDSDLIQQVGALRAVGHPIHLDDFGKGYSSLTYLHQLRIDAIKIDQAFMQAIGTNSIEVDILPQILSIARNLHLSVVVEGIETAEQHAYIAGISDSLMGQGWYYGTPSGLDQLRALVSDSASAARA
ncbi:MAG: EAL domain-containing protein [Acidobacteriota bacterium]